MRTAVLSDIHANREALDAVLVDARRRGVDRFVVLGDLVGYGADPVYAIETAQALQAQGAIILKGNHDEAAASIDGQSMNAYARAAIAWTGAQLASSHRDYLRALPMLYEQDDVLFVHSEAAAPAEWRYVTDAGAAERSMQATERRITLCGHVHRPMLYAMTERRAPIAFVPLANEPVPFLPRRRWLAVMGSVGQPRDENPCACYAILNQIKNEATYYRVGYDIEAAARKIHAAGLPQLLAARLFVGR